jgi:hypothetical protein
MLFTQEDRELLKSIKSEIGYLGRQLTNLPYHNIHSNKLSEIIELLNKVSLTTLGIDNRLMNLERRLKEAEKTKKTVGLETLVDLEQKIEYQLESPYNFSPEKMLKLILVMVKLMKEKEEGK